MFVHDKIKTVIGSIVIFTSLNKSTLYVLSSSAKKIIPSSFSLALLFLNHSKALFLCLTPLGFFHLGS